MLSIVIPSCNRINLLQPTLKKVCEVLKGTTNVELILLDNSSNQPYQSVFETVVNEYKLINFKYIKNKFNVGGNQNILRCIEVSTYDWVWILGDDDEVSDNCMQQILYDIEKNDDACFIHYSKKEIKAEKYDIYYGRKSILKSSLKVNDLNFISSNLLNKRYIKDYLVFAHLYEYTCAPLFYTLLLLAQKENKVLVKHEPILKEIAPNTSPELIKLSYFVIRGFLRLNELPLPNKEPFESMWFKIKCASVFYYWIPPKKLILSIFLDYYAHRNYFKFLYRYFFVAIKLMIVTFNPIITAPFILCSPFLIIPNLSLKALKFLLDRFTKINFPLDRFKNVYLYD